MWTWSLRRYASYDCCKVSITWLGLLWDSSNYFTNPTLPDPFSKRWYPPPYIPRNTVKILVYSIVSSYITCYAAERIEGLYLVWITWYSIWWYTLMIPISSRKLLLISCGRGEQMSMFLLTPSVSQCMFPG